MAFQETVYNEIFGILDEILADFRDFAQEASLTKNGKDKVIDGTAGVEEDNSDGDEYNEPAAYLYGNRNIPEELKAEYNRGLNEHLLKLEDIENTAVKAVKNGELVPMYYIFKAYGLTNFEKLCFMMAFAAASDGVFRRNFNIIFDDYSKDYPTAELLSNIFFTEETVRLEARTSFVEGFESQIGIYDTSVNSADGSSIIQKPLKISGRILDFLYDVSINDSRLEGYMTVIMPKNTEDVPEMYIHGDEVSELEKLYVNRKNSCFICVKGSEGSGRKVLIKNFCRKNNVPLFIINLKKMQAVEKTAGIGAAVDSIIRESILKGNAVITFAGLTGDDEDKAFFQALVWKLEGRMDFFFVTADNDYLDPITVFGIIDMSVPDPGYEERASVWEHSIKKLEAEGLTPDGDVSEISHRISDQYKLTPGFIESACEYARLKALSLGETIVKSDYFVEGCRRHIQHNLNKDATKIKTFYNLDNLILPDSSKQRLVEAGNYIKYKNLVYQNWGFEEKMSYGRGVSMIFYGPPGTGKTMGAQVIANMLGLELYRVELSSIMSKYVGESEKKLGYIFEQGKKSQSILFFDEADSLFGKRSEVKDSHDKYANASTAFLLQKIEDYDGIIILATNLLQNFDNAFMRRFQFVIEFPFPNEEQRTEIWRSVLPDKAPRDFIDFDYLGKQFKLSGAQIKNIMLASLFLAAGSDKVLDMKDILLSIYHEMKKNGKTLLEADFGEYYYLIKGE